MSNLWAIVGKNEKTTSQHYGQHRVVNNALEHEVIELYTDDHTAWCEIDRDMFLDRENYTVVPVTLTIKED